MSSKRREKAYRKIALKAQRSFSFGKGLSLCVILREDQMNSPDFYSIVNSIAKQTYTSFSVIFLTEFPVKKRVLRLLKKFESFTICNKAQLSSELRKGYDVIIPYISAPIPSDEFFRIYQAASLHPATDTFISENNVCDAFSARYYLSHLTEGKSLKTHENVCYTGKRPTPFQVDYIPHNSTRICAGMVLFNPDIEHSVENAKNILPQVEHLFIVDNGSSNIADFAAKFADEKRVTFILNGENKGIAFALNRILDAAHENGYDWVLTLDQDTICDRNMISIYKRYIHLPEIGIISPHIIHRGNKTLEEYKNEHLFETEFIFDFDRCITSASLTNVKAAKEVGGFNDELFIDAVDFDLNIKLISAGYSILKANDTYIIQEIGNRVPVNLFKLIYKLTRIKKFKTVRYFSVHSDFRLYYIARNYKWFLKKYKTTSPTVNRWASFKDMLLRFMLYPKGRSRRAMLKAIRKGYRDSKKMTY